MPNERQVPLGRATIDAGADLVIGHHSHRMNPIELYKGKYICYSLGNFSFAGNAQAGRHGYLHLPAALPRLSGRHGAENADMRIIPCSISSQEKVNDFKPTPKDADGAQALLARLDQLNAQFEKAFSKTAFPPFRRIRRNGSMPIKQLKSSCTSSKRRGLCPSTGRVFLYVIGSQTEYTPGNKPSGPYRPFREASSRRRRSWNPPYSRR